MEDEIEEAAQQLPPSRARHIKKRALKNKALSVSFDEKDLLDYVTGFHKRKKKRRKEAKKKQKEALRRKRIEERKKRKLEKELALYGGIPPPTGTASDESDDHHEDNDGSEPIASINGSTTYENGNLKVTVMTSEISQEDENGPSSKTQAAMPISVGVDKKHNLSVNKKKSFKKVLKQKSRSMAHNKRDRKNGKKRNKKR